MTLQIMAPHKLRPGVVCAIAHLLSFAMLRCLNWKWTTGDNSGSWSSVLAVEPEEQNWPDTVQVNLDWVHFASFLQCQLFQCTAKGFINFASQKILVERTFPLLLSQDVEFAQVHTLSPAITLSEEFEKPFKLKIVAGGVCFATMEDPNVHGDLKSTRAYRRLLRPHGMPQMEKQRCG